MHQPKYMSKKLITVSKKLYCIVLPFPNRNPVNSEDKICVMIAAISKNTAVFRLPSFSCLISQNPLNGCLAKNKAYLSSFHVCFNLLPPNYRFWEHYFSSIYGIHWPLAYFLMLFTLIEAKYSPIKKTTVIKTIGKIFLDPSFLSFSFALE